MEDSSKEPVPLPAYDFNPNDTVILLVGPEERKMLVHGLQRDHGLLRRARVLQ